jgi:hypothetical protein
MRASAAPAYACSVAEIFECTPVARSQRVSAQQANLPPFVDAQCQTEDIVLRAILLLSDIRDTSG